MKLQKCAAIQTYHVKLFADYLEKLRQTPDGDASLLDHVILLYGGGISNSDRHSHGPLPGHRELMWVELHAQKIRPGAASEPFAPAGPPNSRKT